MGKSRRRTVALAVVAVATLLPAGTASALSTGDAPAKKAPHKTSSPFGHIKICKRGLDTIDVYADGQGKTWQDTLNTGPVSCTAWGAMRAGMYDIGFAQNVASQEDVEMLVTYHDNKGRVAHKVFEGQGVFNLLLLPGKDVKIKVLGKRVGGYGDGQGENTAGRKDVRDGGGEDD